MSVPWLVAHRGHPAHFPENSGSGIADALAAGAGWLEVDVQLSREGTPWLYHDEDLRRISGLRGRVEELSDADFSRLPVGEPGRLGERFAEERALSLEAFAALLARAPKARAFVEVKPPAVRRLGAGRTLTEVLARLDPVRERVVLISFSLELLTLARAECSLPIGPILERWGETRSEELLALRPEYLFCNHERLPRRGPIGQEPAALAVYETVDPEQALALHRRGAALVETFAIRAMQAAVAGEGSQA